MPNKKQIILIFIFSFLLISFKVSAQPQITGFTPTEINVGDQVTISGTGFGATQDGGSVKFQVPSVVDSSGWISAGVSSWSDTQIMVTAPMYAMSGPIKVINSASQEGISSQNITIKPTVLSAPTSTTSVKIIFDNYMDGTSATNLSNYTLIVGGSPIDLSEAWADFRGNEVILRNISLTPNQNFQITVSSNVQSVVGTGVDTDHNTASGTVIQGPQITSISPDSGSVGDTITINGTNFGTLDGGTMGDSNHKVYFSPGEPTGPTPPEPVEAVYTGCTGGCTWTDTQIKVRVPTGAKSGPIMVLRNGIESEFDPNSFFDVKGTFQCKIIDSQSGNSIGSSNGRIVIGTMSGPILYYVGDSHSTSYDANTEIFTIPNVSSMGWVWAFDASGDHLTGSGRMIDLTQTVTFSLETATRKISGSISNARADTDIVVWTDPIGDPGSEIEWREPIFVHTDSNGSATFNIGVSLAGKYMVGVEDPGFKTSTTSNPKIAPSPQEVDTTSGNVSGLSFEFASALARIHGQIQKAEGQTFAEGPGTDVFHVFAYEPKENGFHASAMPDSNGEFDLYVNPDIQGDPGVHTYIVEVGGPGLPFSAQQTIEVSNSDPNFALDDSTTDITLVIKAPEDYIEGTVTDSQGNGISGASIFAWSETGPGGGETFTDSSGYYKLYLPPGTYSLEGFAPQYGKLTRRTGIVVSSSQHPTVNFSVSSEMATISGTVTKGGSALANAEVWITEGEFGPGINRTKTDSSGAYTLSVPYTPSGTTYWIHVAIPKVGELHRSAITTTLNNNNPSLTQNITVNTATITVKISPKSAFSEAFVGIHGTGTTRGGGFSDTDTSSATDTFRQYVIEVPKPSSGEYTYSVEGGVLNYGPLPQNMTVDGNSQTNHEITVSSTTSSMTIEFNLGTLYTISGQIPDPDTNTSGNEAAGAFVWAASSTGFGGGEVDSNGAFSFNIPSGTYDIGIDKPGYIGSVIANVDVTSGNYTITSGDLTLTKSTTSISGTVNDSSGNALSEAWVWATNGTGGWAGTQTNGDGEFTLAVGSGDWTVKAIAEGYSESSPHTVSAGTTGLTISLSAVSDYSVAPPKVEPITPKDGGIVQATNVKVEAPAGALGTDTSTGWLIIEDTTNVPTTNSFKPLANKGKKIEAQDSTKTKITTLNSSVTIEITYTASDLSDAGLTQEQALDLSLGYWNSLTETWVALPTTAVPDSAGTGVTYKATTNHLSDFAPLVSSGANPPDTPTGLTATPGDGQIILSWDVSTGADRYYIYRKSNSTYPYYTQTTANSYLDTGLTNGVTYYYKVSALNADGDESAATSAVSATPQSLPGGTVSISYLQPQPEEAVEEEVVEEEVVEKMPEEEVKELPVPVLEKPISEMTIEELEAKIAEFLTAIEKLQALLAEIKGVPTIEGIPSGFSFERNLKAGEVSEEVKYLQIVLNSDPDTQLATEGPGSPGNETTFFGPLTETAVIKFQEKYSEDVLAPWGLSEGTGFVGRTTRAKLNELLAM